MKKQKQRKSKRERERKKRETITCDQNPDQMSSESTMSTPSGHSLNVRALSPRCLKAVSRSPMAESTSIVEPKEHVARTMARRWNLMANTTEVE